MVAETALTFLPLLPDKSSYSYQKTSGVITIALDGGKSRSRLDQFGGTSVVSCEWVLDKFEFDFFMAFYVAVAGKGTTTFQTALILDTPDAQHYDCTFVPDTLRSSSPGSESFFVSAELEVSPLVEQTALDALFKRRQAGLPAPDYFERYYNFENAVDIVEHPVIELTGDYSISFWYYTAADTTFALLGSPDQTVAADHRGVLRYTGTQWLMRHDSYSAGVGITTAAPAFSLWHHIAVVRSLTSVKLYIDGTEVADDSNTVNPLHLRCFGQGYSNTSTYRLLGRMKDYRIYKDRVLLASEVTYFNSEGVSGTDPGTNKLEAYFRMDEASGTVAYDSSGNGNHGTITANDIAAFHDSE